MQILLTEVQLKRIIDLLRKEQTNSIDKSLISYLTSYVTVTQETLVDLDEIPF